MSNQPRVRPNLLLPRDDGPLMPIEWPPESHVTLCINLLRTFSTSFGLRFVPP